MPDFILETVAIGAVEDGSGSTGHVQDRVRVLRLGLYEPDGLAGGDGQQLHLAMSGLLLDPVHHRKGSAGPGPDHQASAVPGDGLLEGQGSMTEGIAEGFRWLLLASADRATIDHDVVVVDHAVDADRAEGELIYAHAIARECRGTWCTNLAFSCRAAPGSG